MTKRDLVDRICAEGFSVKESDGIIEDVLGLMKRTLASGEDVKIHGFGNFVVKGKSSRFGRNPSTGEVMEIRARKRLTFKPSRILRDLINGEVAKRADGKTEK